MTDNFDYVARMSEVLQYGGVDEGERFLSEYIKAKDNQQFENLNIGLTEWTDDNAIKMRRLINRYKNIKVELDKKFSDYIMNHEDFKKWQKQNNK